MTPLKEFLSILSDETNTQLIFISQETDEPIKAAELSIKVLLTVIDKLKKFILKHKFSNEAEEIHFFKTIKPQFVSKLIYHNRIYNIETKRPYGGEEVVRKFLLNELDKLKRFFDNNLDFYKYHRTNSTYLDYKYFVRCRHDIKLSLDTFYFEADHRFATSHDYKVAKIIAHDLVQVYLEDELANLDRKEDRLKASRLTGAKLNWTETKTALTELIYALHSQKVFDHGNVEIKDIAAYFQIVFNIDLGDYYRTYLELRMRKNDRTKFLNSLTNCLDKRMDEAEEK